MILKIFVGFVENQVPINISILFTGPVNRTQMALLFMPNARKRNVEGHMRHYLTTNA